MTDAVRQVLLVEDNHDDVFLLRRAVKTAGVPWNVSVASDGREAMDYLRGNGGYADRTQYPRPSLVLLDLKMPYVDGFEVLRWMQGQAGLKDIPVLVLTSSPEERDQQRALALGAKGYLIKPPTGEMLRTIAAGEG